MNTNNNNSSLLIENGPSFLMGDPFEEVGYLEGDMLPMSLPAPVVVTNVEPPGVKETAPLPPTTLVDERREIPTETDVSVVRTRLGFFEQLSSFVMTDGVKTGIPMNTAPPAKKDETIVEEKQESSVNVPAQNVDAGRCHGADCSVSDDETETRFNHENRLEGCQEPISVDAGRNEVEIEVENESEQNCSNNNSDDEDGFIFLPDIAEFNCNNNNIDPESRFNEFFTGDNNGFHAYQPSAISAQPERVPPFERYIPPTSKCRIGGGTPGAPAAVEGGRRHKLSADKAGVPWGAKKQRVPSKLKYINQEPYQTLKPSGQWTHGTQQQQPSNKQATSGRQDPFPRFLPKKQQCKARPEFREKTTDQGIATSAKPPIRPKRRAPINLDAVRCNCPGLYPEHPSHGPGNYWDEEDDDEAILAEMCPGDDLQECGQGVDNVFPLEEWSDEWEDGVLSGDCTRGGKLAPGTLELWPWENPCLEELYKRKARIQDLRNKRWAELDKARAEAKRLQSEDDGDGGKALKTSKELERKAFNEHGQKGWSLLAWFTPTKWAEGDCNDCASVNRPGKTCTTRTSSGPNVCSPDRRANKCSNNVAGDNSTNNSTNVEVVEIPLESKPTTEAMANYEWDEVEESDEEYSRRMNESQAKANIEERKRRIQRLKERQRLQADRELNAKEAEPNTADARKRRRGVLSTVFGLFAGNDSNNNSSGTVDYVNESVDVGGENANNNAANRCFKPCPPCPQGDCAPPPFECPCNDIHCPKKLKANKDNVQKTGDRKTLEFGNVDVSIDVSADLEIEGIDFSVRKPPPDLSLGCPCGDEQCKKKKCNPNTSKTFGVCEPRNGKMALQEACPVQECERDICDRDGDEPKECPCLDDNCPKKTGSQEGFVFLYPPTEKIKLDENGCPLTQQMHCVVTQIGNKPPEVAVKPVGNKSLHCDPVPPCPCPEFEKLELDSCLCSGNAWGEEISAETDCDTSSKKKSSDDCSGPSAEVDVTADDMEWDYWDGPCGDNIPTPEATAEDILACQEFMEARESNSSNAVAAIEAALEAFEIERIRKERAVVEAATRKRRIEEMREIGMTEDEIVDQLCSDRVPGPCEIMGEFPPQEACAPNPPPPGCPCPDPACPKRAPFDYQMHDTDLAKIKNPYDYANTEKYLKSEPYKTMDCELRYPTYKDITKSYPKRQKTKCPCPECVTTTQKAWAAVEKFKVGPPPDCPCKDPKCPKKPIKMDEEEVKIEETNICAMPTYYPDQSGCPEVLRCDLLSHPCGIPKPGEQPKKPQERYRCHTCSTRNPMPKQAACPDFDCNECKLVCHKCACEPKKCEKCEEAKFLANSKPIEHAPCPPCTVKGPLPKQSDCKEIHPCDEKHPCMCDPNTGEPIDAERCGPCDTKNHDLYPKQGGCQDSSSNAETSAKLELDEISYDGLEEKQTTSNNENTSDTAASEVQICSLESTIEEEISAETQNNAEPLEHLIEDSGEYPEIEQDIAIEETIEPEVVAPSDVKGNQEDPSTSTIKEIDEETVVEKSVLMSMQEPEEGTKRRIVDEAFSPSLVEEVEGESLHSTEQVESVVDQAVEPTEEVAAENAEESGDDKIEKAELNVAEGGETEGTFVDVKKGTTASVKVEFRVVGLQLTEEELKAVGEAFTRQEEEEAAVSKEAMAEELKKAALEAVKEKMKRASPASNAEGTKQNPATQAGKVADNFDDMQDQCTSHCSFSGMEISAFLPAFLRPKTKCHPKPRKRLEHRYRSTTRSCKLTSLVDKDQEDLVHGLNAIDNLNMPRSDEGPFRGIIQRSSQMKMAKAQKSSGSFGRNWMAKKQELVLVNNDDGAIDIIKFDQLSEENQTAIDEMFNVAKPSVAAK